MTEVHRPPGVTDLSLIVKSQKRGGAILGSLAADNGVAGQFTGTVNKKGAVHLALKGSSLKFSTQVVATLSGDALDGRYTSAIGRHSPGPALSPPVRVVPGIVRHDYQPLPSSRRPWTCRPALGKQYAGSRLCRTARPRASPVSQPRHLGPRNFPGYRRRQLEPRHGPRRHRGQLLRPALRRGRIALGRQRDRTDRLYHHPRKDHRTDRAFQQPDRYQRDPGHHGRHLLPMALE